MLKPEPFPEEVRTLIAENARRAGAERDCLDCDASCCATSGFAVLANVALAYQQYAGGALDFQFEPGLSAQEFLYRYFDIVQAAPGDTPGAPPFLVYFPRSLVHGASLESLSPVEDRQTGEYRVLTLPQYLESRKAWIAGSAQYARSCIFRHGRLPRGDGSGRAFAGCVLHADLSPTHLTGKPIDCIFQACVAPPELLEPDPALAHRWLEALRRHYGGGQEP